MITATQDDAYNLSADSSSCQAAQSRGAVTAVALTIGYCALVSVLVAGPLWMAYAETVRPDGAPGRILLWVVATALVLWMALPQADRLDPLGARILPEDEPALFAVIHKVARQTRQPMPTEVYLVNEVRASAAWRGGIAGFGGRRVLLLGLPLIDALSIQELEAILAHEFGHSEDGTVVVGPWILRTRTAIASSMRSQRSAAASVFAWYGTLFLRATRDVARRQELVADDVAVRLAGSAAMISALRTVHTQSVAYRTYVQQELQPVLDLGYLPPVGAGFRRFLNAPGTSAYVGAVLQYEEALGEPDPLDAHPSMTDRLTALEPLPPQSAADTRRASSLLSDVIRREHAVFGAIDSSGSWNLQPLEWDQVAGAVYLPLWRARADSHGHLLRRHTIGTLPTTSVDFVALGSMVSGRDGEAPSERAFFDRAGHLILAAIAVRLAEHGWSVTALPGDETILRRNGHELRPYSELRAVLDGRVPASRWRERCTELGISDVQLWGAADSVDHRTNS